MRINYIELVGFLRLSLNNINSIRITPAQRVQLILGTNASGKSSLMGELSPLPAVSANYSKNGSKTISITHRGDEYLLKSSFSPQNHSIIKNGDEELNPGGTITIQRELVKTLFGVTQETHDLVTGLERFTSMSPTRRREWFTKLSDNDHQYALQVYGLVKDRLRDTVGALKLAKKRLVAETAKLISPEAMHGIEMQISTIVSEIDILYTSRVEESRPYDELDRNWKDQEKELEALTQRFFKLKQTIVPESWLTISELEEGRNGLYQEQAGIDSEINVLTKEHSGLKETYDAFEKSGGVGLEDLRTNLVNAKGRKEALLATSRLSLVFEDPVLSLSAFESVRSILHGIFSEIPENSDRRYSFAKLQAAREARVTLETNLGSDSDKLQRLQHQKFHQDSIKNGEQTNCPNCNHKWYPGYSEAGYKKLTELIDKGIDHIDKIKKKMVELDEVIALNLSYGDFLKQYSSLNKSATSLQPFWDFLNTEEVVFNAPRRVLVHIESLAQDLSNASKAVECDREIKRLEELIEIALKASNVDMGKLKTRIDGIEERLGALAKRKSYLVGSIQNYTDSILKMKVMDSLIESIKVTSSMLNRTTDDMIRSMKNDVINDCLRTLQITLAQKQSALNDARMQKGIVDDIQSSINRLEVEEEALKVLEASLSPTTGLIAEGLFSFIRSMVKKMNTVIRRIWTYPMEIQDCVVDEENGLELDYRFPVLTKGAVKPTPDVKQGSAGMIEMVDLAFIIIAMHNLGMGDYPLLLDEFGKGFDHTHRQNATNAIKTILDQLPFSQLWMISHYQDSYQTFTNAEICVLCDSNIVLPSKEQYNKHVIMS